MGSPLSTSRPSVRYTWYASISHRPLCHECRVIEGGMDGGAVDPFVPGVEGLPESVGVLAGFAHTDRGSDVVATVFAALRTQPASRQRGFERGAFARRHRPDRFR